MNMAQGLELLKSIVSSVVEQSAFLFTDDPETSSGENPPDELFYKASINFTGSPSGRISLYLPDFIAGESANNMLGLDKGEDAEPELHKCDSCGELLNVCCGQFLSASEGAKAVFNLSIPKVSRMTFTQIKGELDSRPHIKLLIESHSVYIVLEISE